MFRHIRSKLIAAFAVPLAVLVAVAGLEASSSLTQIKNVDQQTALASASAGPGGVVQALQTERIYAVLSIFTASLASALPPSLRGLTPASDDLYGSAAKLEAQTNAAVASFETTVGGAGLQAQEIYAQAFQQLGNLSATRAYWARASTLATASAPHAYIADYKPLVTETYRGYTNIIDALESGTASVPLKVNDPTLRTGVEAMYTGLEQTEAQWQVVEDLFVADMSSGSAQKAQILQATQDWGADLSWTARLNSFNTGPFVDAIYNQGQSSVNNSIEQDIGFMDLGQVPPMQSVLQAFTQTACVRTAAANCVASSETPTAFGEGQIAAIVNSRASHLRTSAVEQAIAFGALGALGTILGLVLVVMVSRSVSRPLVDLARQADELASTTLPSTVKAILEASASGAEAPQLPKVSVNSRDEVAGMARALDAVNKTAVELAAGQAALRRNLSDAFVNLGRRNQNLVTRQLEYISEIELKEADPESLEELFRLDHLATRMRRNAESLLILAGSGPARQWSAAVPAMDVARAASAEVEDYKRLRLHHFDPAQIAGAVTTDLVHIMAELIENALTFSPPGSPVDVYGRFLEGGYVIVIVDSGIGMSADDLETANRRLEGEGTDNEVPGRYLGHFVAGRLAARHAIAISLQASHSGGLVARVKIPAPLIEEPVPDLSAYAEVRSSPVAPTATPRPAADPVVIASPPPADPWAPTAAPVPEHTGGATLNGNSHSAGAFHDAETVDESANDAERALAQWAGELAGPAWSSGPETEDVSHTNGFAGHDVAAYDPPAPAYDPPAPASDPPAPAYEPPVPGYDAPGADPADEVGPALHEDYNWVTAAPDHKGATDHKGPVSYEYGQTGTVSPTGPPVAEPEPEAAEPEVAPWSFVQPVPSAGHEVVRPAPEVIRPAPTEAAPRPAQATPDFGILSPLAATAAPDLLASPHDPFGSGARPQPQAQPQPQPVVPAPAPAPAAAPTSAAWDTVPRPEPWDLLPKTPAAPEASPATQGRTTAEGLRKLTRRVPGASLPQEDGALRRSTPTSTTRNPLGLTGALSQYLSATVNEGRPEKEQNGR